jgi:hypothetical protein
MEVLVHSRSSIVKSSQLDKNKSSNRVICERRKKEKTVKQDGQADATQCAVPELYETH